MVQGWVWSQDAKQTSSLCSLLMYDLGAVTQRLDFFIWKVEMSLYFPRWRRNGMWWPRVTLLLMQVKNGQILAISWGSTCAWKVLSTAPAGGQDSLNPKVILSPFHRLGYHDGKRGSRRCRKAWGPMRGAKEDRVEKPQNGAKVSGNSIAKGWSLPPFCHFKATSQHPPTTRIPRTLLTSLKSLSWGRISALHLSLAEFISWPQRADVRMGTPILPSSGSSWTQACRQVSPTGRKAQRL